MWFLSGEVAQRLKHFVDGENQNALGDDFFMRHKAQIKRSRLTILPKRAMCMEVIRFETYYADEGSGL